MSLSRATVLRHLGDASSRSTSPLTSLSSSSVESDDDDDEDRRRELAHMDLEEMYTKSDAALALLTLHERVSRKKCFADLSSSDLVVQRAGQSSSTSSRLEHLIHVALSDVSILELSERVRNC